MDLLACVLWLWCSALAGLLLVIGHAVALPGRAIVFVAEFLLERLGD